MLPYSSRCLVGQMRLHLMLAHRCRQDTRKFIEWDSLLLSKRPWLVCHNYHFLEATRHTPKKDLPQTRHLHLHIYFDYSLNRQVKNTVGTGEVERVMESH